MQTSISAWLNKPKAVVEPPPNRQEPEIASEALVAVPLSKPVASQSIASSDINTQLTPAHASGDIERVLDRLKSSSKHVRPIPPNVTICPVSQDLIQPFRRLNTLLLPIPYQDKFYKETLEDPVIASITFAALWSDSAVRLAPSAGQTQPIIEPTGRLVGAIRCRIVPAPNPQNRPQLYIATLGTLAPYRSHGIALSLLELVTFRAIELYNIDCVTAHVWEAQDDILRWYEKRGFEVVRRMPGYYKRLNPPDAVFVARHVSPLDLGPMHAFRSEG